MRKATIEKAVATGQTRLVEIMKTLTRLVGIMKTLLCQIQIVDDVPNMCPKKVILLLLYEIPKFFTME